MSRCGALHPSHPEVRCEEPTGHTEDHFHSFYMRAWGNAPRQRVAPCPCECNDSPRGFCGGCGHAGCSGGINLRR